MLNIRIVDVDHGQAALIHLPNGKTIGVDAAFPFNQFVFIQYGTFCILFPGDLEKKGWRAL